MYYRSPRDKPGNISARFNSERKKFETNKIKSFGRWKKVLLEKFCVCVCVCVQHIVCMEKPNIQPDV